MMSIQVQSPDFSMMARVEKNVFFLASLSGVSLPGMLLYPGTHTKIKENRLAIVFSDLRSSLLSLILYGFFSGLTVLPGQRRK